LQSRQGSWLQVSGVHDSDISLRLGPFLRNGPSLVIGISPYRDLPMAGEPKGNPNVVYQIHPSSREAVVLQERFGHGTARAKDERTLAAPIGRTLQT